MFSSEEDESAAAQKLADFLFDSYADDIHRILLDDDPSKLHFPLVIECVLPISSSRSRSPAPSPNPNPISTRRFAELMEFDPKFAGKLYLDPHKYLPFLKDAAQWAQVSEPSEHTTTSCISMPIPHSFSETLILPCRTRC
jgi:DNA helicase MCM9